MEKRVQRYLEEQSQQPPLIFRGHHLEMLVDLALEIQTPGGLAAVQKTGFQLDRARLIGSRSPGYGDGVDYYNDVIGTSKEQGRQYQRDIKQVFQDFVYLPSTYPVELVAGIPDTICGACVVGNHCRNRGSKRVPGQTTGAMDQRFLEVFTDEAKKLGKEEGKHFTRGRKVATYSDGASEELFSLQTTLGTVRSVLRDTPVDWDNIVPSPRV